MDYSKVIRYIKNETSPAETKEVENWKSQPGNNEKYEEILLIWETSEKALQPSFSPDTNKAWQKVNQSLSEPKQENRIPFIKKYYTKLAFAAGFLLIFTMGWFLLQTYHNKTTIEQEKWISIHAESKSQKQVILPDGTKIWLNKNSKIEYPETFKDQAREVRLEGEAFFEVAHNKKKPFRVFTPHSLTEVLGTSFHINAFEQMKSTEINVVNGKVAFSDNKYEKRKLILKKGEKGILTSENILIKDKVNDNMDFLAWKTGNLRFSGTSLNEVCTALSEFYGKTIQLDDSSMNDIDLTASFYEQSLEEVLDIINLTLDTK